MCLVKSSDGENKNQVEKNKKKTHTHKFLLESWRTIVGGRYMVYVYKCIIESTTESKENNIRFRVAYEKKNPKRKKKLHVFYIVFFFRSFPILFHCFFLSLYIFEQCRRQWHHQTITVNKTKKPTITYYTRNVIVKNIYISKIKVSEIGGEMKGKGISANIRPKTKHDEKKACHADE